jgi:D-alanyl-D-alanine dipeptidase
MNEQENRLFLKELLERNGFKNYDLEWWHFTFVSEKNRDYEYMDFLIK